MKDLDFDAKQKKKKSIFDKFFTIPVFRAFTSENTSIKQWLRKIKKKIRNKAKNEKPFEILKWEMEEKRKNQKKGYINTSQIEKKEKRK